ncbi:DUF2939 domain-containing protein [Selenomonas sp. KH1T6]|uniref:DUF2939 domain-containing protein n=1 Tax=Selenomonas sp. KH1T6 TaxID=3158784 RepID=UPI0008A7315B|nr:Protein of unknown function [Selenomonas ruminantium]
MGRSLRMKLYLLLAVLVLLAMGSGYWYFQVYTKTPDYALQKIERALEEHDQKTFERYVDMDALLDKSYDDLMEGLMDAEQPLSTEAKFTVGNFTQMLKAPLITSFKQAVEQYVNTGSWTQESKESSQGFEAAQVLEKSGICESSFRKVDSMAKDKEAGTAIAKVRIFQQEANEEFVLDVQFTEQPDGTWRITEINNFHEFVMFLTKARRAQLIQYADTTAEIISRHDAAMMQAQEQFNNLLSRGTLGSDETRKALKNFMEGTIKADWQQRKTELEAVTVPAAAQTLHHLRLRICDLHIAYAAGYAAWMTDKKATTIREADRQLKQAKTLEQEEKFLARRVGAPAEGE